MIKINRIKTYIDAENYIGRFGFDHKFDSGLNIIYGDNSSGKSTILSCLYYCLGMEQLLGGNREKILDKSLRSTFTIDTIDYKVVYSEAIIEIENKSGQKAIVKRVIKGRGHENTNSLVVKEYNDGKESTNTYYVRSTGDHDNENGFYNWLKNFTNIQLPTIYQTDGKKAKSLYLQNLMSCALVEQTKGWSDLFSQMPYFGIKDPKTKVVEYLLDLKSLEDDIKKDILEQEKNELKKKWLSYIENFNLYMSRYSIQLDGITERYKAKTTVNSVNRSDIYCILDGNSTKVKSVIKDLKKQLSDILKSDKKSSTDESTAEQTKLINEIRSLNKQLRELEHKKVTEKQKINEYNDLIEKNNTSIEQISGIKKVNKINDLKVIEQCPTCNSKLGHESRMNIDDSQIDFEKSMAFLKSQLDLYTSYVKSSTVLFEKLDNAISYYRIEIKNKNLQLNLLKKDITEKEVISREKIHKEISLTKSVSDLESAITDFSDLKAKLIEIIGKIDDIDVGLNNLDINKQEDANQIANFSREFNRYLDDFEYSSNSIDSVKIKEDYPSKLLPFIEIYNFGKANEMQPIRLSSSASDFVRSEWAYYFSLMSCSRRHPGFLVFDEPGQHAMKPSSMKSLISASINTNKQVILAISKSVDKYSNTEAVIEVEGVKKLDNDYLITEAISLGDVNVIDIDPNNLHKSVAAL
ncbi:ATP-binding protein [Vibrio kanaloae]|uniref:ATP-binding protein n=2 Tax=Vibrio TaxID=662 RepID=UPI0011B565FF|nr:ATP-binding protein [Vibrio kanaloae]